MSRQGVAEALRDVGIHTGEAQDVDTARADILFLRRMRQWFEGASNKIGSLILPGAFTAIGALLILGVRAWIGAAVSGGH